MAQLHTLSDEPHLIERMKSSDAAVRNAAFREFVRLNMRRVYAHAYQLSGNSDDADDLTQEVFVRALEALPRFQGASALATWLHRITVNLHIDFTRSARYRYAAAWDDTRDNDATHTLTTSAAPLPDARADGAFRHAHFEQALGTLPAQQRTVVVLRYLQEYSLEEIAEELGVTLGTVKTLIFRAVRGLRKALSIYEQEFSTTSFSRISNEDK
ncbi:MAG: RNA polymerase sigma factor [Ignavibacteria bacterium]|nr:RNA polymerase sigma factor [Ignavibacteria bacterium]MBL7991692.1 RNA polymerase sigma factor [Candidatus Kapabacteria bacterium]